jgi:prevent-host-death family protein
VGSFEAKTRLAELLREVERGGSFVILRRGKQVAELVPPAVPDPGFDPKRLLAAFRSIRKRAGKKTSIRKWIEEGRRF